MAGWSIVSAIRMTGIAVSSGSQQPRHAFRRLVVVRLQGPDVPMPNHPRQLQDVEFLGEACDGVVFCHGTRLPISAAARVMARRVAAHGYLWSKTSATVMCAGRRATTITS